MTENSLVRVSIDNDVADMWVRDSLAQASGLALAVRQNLGLLRRAFVISVRTPLVSFSHRGKRSFSLTLIKLLGV